MKQIKFHALLILSMFTFLVCMRGNAVFAENIDPFENNSQFAYGENVGWINLEPVSGEGVTVDDSALTGYAWSENIGWINLSPEVHGGVMNDGNGNLSGYAWGENVGWINFGPEHGGVTIDHNGDFDGRAWGENIGWIHFRSTGPVAYKVQTEWSKDVDFQISLRAGWSMISLSVVPSDPRLSALFPGAVVMYRYERDAGYVHVKAEDVLQVGAGYWILVNQDQNYMLTGQPIPSYSKTVYGSGWEMIGGCTSEAMPTTDNCKIGVIYIYEMGAGYVRVSSTEAMEPGKGFWILLKEVEDQCLLTVNAIKQK